MGKKSNAIFGHLLLFKSIINQSSSFIFSVLFNHLNITEGKWPHFTEKPLR